MNTLTYSFISTLSYIIHTLLFRFWGFEYYAHLAFLQSCCAIMIGLYMSKNIRSSTSCFYRKNTCSTLILTCIAVVGLWFWLISFGTLELPQFIAGQRIAIPFALYIQLSISHLTNHHPISIIGLGIISLVGTIGVSKEHKMDALVITIISAIFISAYLTFTRYITHIRMMKETELLLYVGTIGTALSLMYLIIGDNMGINFQYIRNPLFIINLLAAAIIGPISLLSMILYSRITTPIQTFVVNSLRDAILASIVAVSGLSQSFTPISGTVASMFGCVLYLWKTSK